MATTYDEIFDWTSEQKGRLLGSFYYGYVVTQIPSGYMSGYYGAKLPYLVGIFLTSVFTLCAPAAARYNINALMAIRILMGLSQGVSFPLMSTIFGRWAPPAERTKLLAITSAGVQLGTVIAFPLCGALGIAFGWASMFYFFGIFGLLFCIPWYFFAFDSPEEHPRITGEEKSYIVSSIGAPAMGAKPSRVPWRRICRSLPFWSLITSCWCSDWGFYTLLSDVPLYLQGNLHFGLKDNANFAGVPYIVMWVVIVTFSPVADWIISREMCSVTVLRKVATVIGTVIPAFLLIGIPLSGCSIPSVLALLALSTGFTGFASCGFRVNFNDISPSHAGFIYAIGNSVGTITGFVGPAVTGTLTSGPHGHSSSNWQKVFFIAAGFYFLGCLVYVLFGSGEQQNWDNKEKGFNTYRVAPEALAEKPLVEGVNVMPPTRRKSYIPPWIPPSQNAQLTESTVHEQEKRRRSSIVPPGMEANGMEPGKRGSFAERSGFPGRVMSTLTGTRHEEKPHLLPASSTLTGAPTPVMSTMSRNPGKVVSKIPPYTPSTRDTYPAGAQLEEKPYILPASSTLTGAPMPVISALSRNPGNVASKIPPYKPSMRDTHPDRM
ncbi:sialin-like isoform X2 [Paramacrobiotus metropolitanus]|uniref:sialin-like isoform X2 n=1 Tax=Paramacrobiotus metropolitanus TaxID=2943436 RepID=UPI0024462AFE|nr:sialin-like isoform X2 [Paramacrobiotus metropolitanus]